MSLAIITNPKNGGKNSRTSSQISPPSENRPPKKSPKKMAREQDQKQITDFIKLQDGKTNHTTVENPHKKRLEEEFVQEQGWKEDFSLGDSSEGKKSNDIIERTSKHSNNSTD